MAKVWNYVVIAAGLVLLFKMAGIDYGANSILTVLGLGTASVSIGTAGFWNTILGSAGILIGIIAGVVVGFFTRSAPENYIILPLITGTLGAFIQAFVGLMQYSIANYPVWIYSIIILILGPFTIGFLVALVEFFRGTD